MQEPKVFKYFYGNRWYINYDQIEPFVKEYLQRKAIK